MSHSPLDPPDWDVFRRQAHDLLDHLIGKLEYVADGPVWRPVPDAVKQRLAVDSPSLPQGVEQVCAELRELVLPYGAGNTHPRFWGWVHGTGTPGGMLAEMAAAALNTNCGGRDHGAIYVERAVIEWARQWFGFPTGGGGLLVGGTSMANLLGLTVARNHKAGRDIRAEGLGDLRMVGYTSAEGHSCLTKAFEVLGLGRQALRRVGVDDHCRMDVAALCAAVAADRAAGLQPFCVIATAGSVNTGAIDDLAAIADFCRDEGLWLHIDGAFGAVTILSEALAPRLAGIERADSIAFDFHKWLHVPYDAGCILVRDQALQEATFGGRPHYLATAGGLAGGDPLPCDLGVELSRGFRALKVWFTLKEQGTQRLAEAMERNCAQARALADRIQTRPLLRLMAPLSLQIVCLRYQPPGFTEEAVDLLNARLVAELQERGIAAPSTCQLQGRLCIRICITNHRSGDEDFVLLVEAIEEIGAELVEG
ncbi:MAG TPA: pyridoxal-dependent decarboxylase [Patescibacteria group bacterium]|nr:pyridoxal-dependent decarboxylase [Patescibacteria group bacterium]